MKGEENVYTCQKCGCFTVTIDTDEGVTPFMLDCRASGREGDCDGMAESAFYPKGPRPAHIPAPSWEWYKVERWEVIGEHRVETREYHNLDPGLKDHVDKGGLLIRKLNA